MDLDILNFSKQPEVVKVYKTNRYPFRKTHYYMGLIIPNRVIKDNCGHEITHITEELYIHGFVITTYLKEDKITALNVFGDHPNCDLNTNTFCLPEWKKDLTLNQDTLNMMLANLHTFYLDNAHFIPGKGQLRYKKLDSMHIQLTRGER